ERGGPFRGDGAGNPVTCCGVPRQVYEFTAALNENGSAPNADIAAQGRALVDLLEQTDGRVEFAPLRLIVNVSLEGIRTIGREQSIRDFAMRIELHEGFVESAAGIGGVSALTVTEVGGREAVVVPVEAAVRVREAPRP